MVNVWNKLPFRTTIKLTFPPWTCCLTTVRTIATFATKLCFAMSFCDWNLLLRVTAHAGRTNRYDTKTGSSWYFPMHFCGVAHKVSLRFIYPRTRQDFFSYFYCVNCITIVVLASYTVFSRAFLCVCWSWMVACVILVMVMWFWNHQPLWSCSMYFKKDEPLVLLLLSFMSIFPL